jgi:hypothetical protein
LGFGVNNALEHLAPPPAFPASHYQEKACLSFETRRPGGRVLPGAASLPYRSIGVLQKNFQKFFEKWLGKILTIPLILFALDSSLPFSLRASLVRAGPRSFTVQTFGLLIPARTLW